MKYLNSTILVLVLGFLLEFYPPDARSHPVPIDPSKLTFLKDSINKLDSLVKRSVIINSALSIKYARKALSYARKLKTAEDIVHGYSLMGQAFYRKDKDSSFVYFNKALILADSAKIEAPKPFLIFNCARIYYTGNNVELAMKLMDSCVKMANSQKDYVTMTRALNELGNINVDIKNRQDAFKMYDSANRIATRHSLPSQIGLTLGNLARFQDDPIKAFKLNREAIRYLKKGIGNEEGMGRIYNNMGRAATNPDTALSYFREALKLAKNKNFPEIEMAAYNLMAYSYLDKGNISSAEECLIGHAILLAEKEKNDDWMATLSDTYSDVLVRKGDFKAAAKWQKTAMLKRVAADQAKATEQVRLLGVLLDLKSKELTIQDNQREILVQQNRLQKTRLGLTITIFMIIGFIFIILWLQQRNRVRLQKQQIQSAKRIIEMEEEEKAKVARELHDITGQLVMGITGEIENLDMPDTKIKDEIKEKIRDLGKSIRLISHKMNKAMLDNFTFEELIIGQCEDIKKAVGLQVQLEMPEEPLVLEEEVVLHAYRIVQELLTNAGKYARDSFVSLVFLKTPTELILTYYDNGPGFDSSLIEKKGMGLMNIFERSKLLNGSARVTSAPGDGTSWEIKFPLIQAKIKT